MECNGYWRKWYEMKSEKGRNLTMQRSVRQGAGSAFVHEKPLASLGHRNYMI